MEAEFRKQVKDALEHLYDTAYLQVHPLLSQVAGVPAANQTTRAQRLRGLLKDTIESLRPQQGSPSSSPEWRSYLALRYHYVQGMSMLQTESELGISLRQLQRELHKGVDALAQLLWDRRAPDAPPVTPSTEPPASELQELQNELNQWEITRQPCEVQTLIADALWMLQPVLNQATQGVSVSLATDLPPVLVDSTLTRQALFKLIRWLIHQAGSISIQAHHRCQYVDLILQGQGVKLLPTTPDWQMAELFLSQQGGKLTIREGGASADQVILSLPCTHQPRVLVIDDNRAIHRLFERYLTPQQYEVIHAYNGQEALRLAAEAHPDLITLDVMMPNLDGWQVLRHLAQEAATCHIPIIVCSVLREPELAFSLGARAYLKKPVERVELLTTLARFCPPATPAPATHSPTPPGN